MGFQQTFRALSDETVWNKTQRLTALLVPLAAACLVPTVMSFVWYQKRLQ